MRCDTTITEKPVTHIFLLESYILGKKKKKRASKKVKAYKTTLFQTGVKKYSVTIFTMINKKAEWRSQDNEPGSGF